MKYKVVLADGIHTVRDETGSIVPKSHVAGVEFPYVETNDANGRRYEISGNPKAKIIVDGKSYSDVPVGSAP